MGHRITSPPRQLVSPIGGTGMTRSLAAAVFDLSSRPSFTFSLRPSLTREGNETDPIGTSPVAKRAEVRHEKSVFPLLSQMVYVVVSLLDPSSAFAFIGRLMLENIRRTSG